MQVLRGYTGVSAPPPLSALFRLLDRAERAAAVDRFLEAAQQDGFPDLLGQTVVDLSVELPYADRLEPTTVHICRVQPAGIVGGGWASIPRAWRLPGGPYAALGVYPNPQRLRHMLRLLLGCADGEIEPLQVIAVAGYLFSQGDDHYLYAARLLGRTEVTAEVAYLPYEKWLQRARLEVDAAHRIWLVLSASADQPRRLPLTAQQAEALARRFPLPVTLAPDLT